jgi:hypothetical protein
MSATHQKQEIIFVGGSIAVKNLPQTIINLLDIAMDNNANFVVGEARGVDTMVQHHLHIHRYPWVTVYCMNNPRTTYGGWNVRVHTAPVGVRGSAWHAVKDRAMDAAATSGIMIWNGSSSGTRNNILALLRTHKPCTVWNTTSPTLLRTYTTVDEFLNN